MYTNYRSFVFLSRKITRLALYRPSLKVSFALKKNQANLRPIRVVSLFGISNKKCITRQKLSLTSTLYAFTSFPFHVFSIIVAIYRTPENNCQLLVVFECRYDYYMNPRSCEKFLFSFVVSGRKNTIFKKKKKKKTMFYSIVDNRKNKTLQSYAYDWERNGGAEQLALKLRSYLC